MVLEKEEENGGHRKIKSRRGFSVPNPSPMNGFRDAFYRSTSANYYSGPPVDAPRLIKRDLPFNQSSNNYQIYNKYVQLKWKFKFFLFYNDFFHVMLRFPTFISLFLLIGTWTLSIMFFALLYIAADNRNPDVNCGLATPGNGDTTPWYTAFAFSLETSTTVGYGLPGSSTAFFEDCPYVQVTIFFQMVFSMIFNAFLLSFVFSRISRSESRSYQVLFTRNALVRKDHHGRLIFEVKVYDTDPEHPLAEAHVRMYAVHCSSDRCYTTLRIVQPNDDLGAKILTSIPTTIVHHIDAYSALLPPSYRRGQNVVNDFGLVLREIDSYTCSRDGFICPVCAESYGTPERLRSHIQFNQRMEKHDEVPIKGSHQELSESAIRRLTEVKVPSIDEIRQHCESSKLEIIVIVESINPLTSTTFQAIQSYRHEDIVYGGEFVSNFTPNNEVDLKSFHVIKFDEDVTDENC